MTTVPHTLSPADSAQAKHFAGHIWLLAHPADRCRIARYGMDIFQQVPPPLDAELEYLATLYLLPIPGLTEFMEPIMDAGDDPRLSAFESAIALHVHLLCTNQTPQTLTLEASNGSI